MTFAHIILGLFAFLTIVCLFGSVKSIFAPVKTEEAVVIDKHTFETPSKYSPTGKQASYIVVFSVNGKRKRFYVSSFTYGGYRVGESGVLKYKGNKIIEFE